MGLGFGYLVFGIGSGVWIGLSRVLFGLSGEFGFNGVGFGLFFENDYIGWFYLGVFDTVENFVENLVLGRFLLVIWLWKSRGGFWVVDWVDLILKLGVFLVNFELYFCSQCLVESPRGNIGKSLLQNSFLYPHYTEKSLFFRMLKKSAII